MRQLLETLRIDVSAAFRGGTPCCRLRDRLRDRLRGRFGLPTLSMRAALACVEKMVWIFGPFESLLSRN